MPRSATGLSELARLGFDDLGGGRDRLDRLVSEVPGIRDLVPWFATVADPDAALRHLERSVERDRAGVVGCSTAGPVRAS